MQKTAPKFHAFFFFKCLKSTSRLACDRLAKSTADIAVVARVVAGTQGHLINASCGASPACNVVIVPLSLNPAAEKVLMLRWR
jgi:hypothetical protein